MTTKVWGKDIKAYEDIDFDEILSKLTPEEIEELNNDVDPDNSLLPASQRCRDQTTKQPTGDFDRDHLMKFLEDRSKNEPDREEKVPYKHETRGRVYKPKTSEPGQTSVGGIEDKDNFLAEFDDVLKNASEDELCDLAAVLGLTSLMNQVQFQASQDNKSLKELGGFSAVAHAAQFRLMPDEPPNTTDVEGSIKRLKNNDKDLTELNLNNIKAISNETFAELFNALKSNTHLEKLHCANTGLTDTGVQPLIDALASGENKTLKVLTLESNVLTGATLISITNAAVAQGVIEELHFLNQAQQVLGVKVEEALLTAVEKSTVLIRFGVQLQIPNARLRIQDKLQTNMDARVRQERISKRGLSPTPIDRKVKPQPIPRAPDAPKSTLKTVGKN